MNRAGARFPLLLVVLLLCGVGARGATQQEAPQLDPDSGGADELPRLVHLDELRALRTFFDRVDVGSVADGVAAPGAAASGLDAAIDGLPDDFAAPFFFVRGTIRHAPYVGSVRGALGTLDAGAGNALDQALLLQELFAARNVTTRLMRGSLDWDAAVSLIGGAPMAEAPQAADAWPRWVEQAADHWWLQARSDDGWVDFDAGFADAEPGEARARSGSPQASVPDELMSALDIELLRGNLVVAAARHPPAEIVGGVVSLSFASESRAGIGLWREFEDSWALLRQLFAPILRSLGWWLGAPAPRPSTEEVAGAAPTIPGAESTQNAGDAATPPAALGFLRPSAFERIYLNADAGPWRAQLAVAGQTLEVGPLEATDLDALSLRLTINAPQAPPQILQIPWGGGPNGRLAVVVGAGAVAPAALRQRARGMYRALNDLAIVEQAARVNMRPPIAYRNAADALRDEAMGQWGRFAMAAPETLAWALLRGLEGVSEQSPAARVVRPGLRLAAVRWRPPSARRAGALEVWTSDPVVVGRVAAGVTPAALRSAAGLLQSAVYSQVLNRLTETAPETAFDVTLRAIGTGMTLQGFATAEELPAAWPLSARAAAAQGLRAGYRLLAPASFASGGAGWWTVSPFDGETRGWVSGPATALQGSVTVGAPGSLTEFDALLASLPRLHRALRWLADLPGTGPLSLATVPDAACASATVTADIMADGMPPQWPRPDVRSMCGPR